MSWHIILIGGWVLPVLVLAMSCATRSDDSAPVAQPPASPGMLTILHTNDLHGHVTAWRGWEGPLQGKMVGGMDRLAGVVKSVRRDLGAENVLLLDAGDAIGDTMIAARTRGKAVLKLMETVGYDAMALGNHEPDFAPRTLRQYIAETSFPLLAANILDEQSGQLIAKPFIVRDVAGVKVAILGLAYPNTPLTTAEKNVQGLRFRRYSAAVVHEQLPHMRKAGAQIIVVLSHLGLAGDAQLAREAEMIDVIVGGHSHNRMSEAMQVGRTLIVQAGAHGSDVGRLDLKVEGGRIVSHHHRLITLDHAVVPSDLQAAQALEAVLAPHRAALNEPVCQAASPIIRAQTLAGQDPRKRDQQSPADSLFADIIREQTASDVALLPGVGYGVAIHPGTVTADDLRNLIPHDAKVVTLSLTGEQVRQVLEQSVENVYTDDVSRKVGGMIQVSGLRFTYSSDAAPGERVREVQIGTEALVSSQRYQVATNAMLAGGGHRYDAFLRGENRREHEPQYEMVRDWMQSRQTVSAPSDVRISGK